MITNEQELVESIADSLVSGCDGSIEAHTFEEKMMMTNDKGLVVVVRDEEGNEKEYQLTVVRSK